MTPSYTPAYTPAYTPGYTPAYTPPPLTTSNPSGTSGGAGMPSDVVLSTLNVADAERVLIQHALAQAHGNRTKAAELLGISVRTLRNKLNQPGEDADDATP